MRASLEYLIGKEITSVEVAGDEPHEWVIEFDDGSQIRNHDEKLTNLPEEAVGYRLLTVILVGTSTRLMIGTSSEAGPNVHLEWGLNPLEYSLMIPSISNEPVFPQRPDQTPLGVEVAGIPDPSSERVREAPDAPQDVPEEEDSPDDA